MLVLNWDEPPGQSAEGVPVAVTLKVLPTVTVAVALAVHNVVVLVPVTTQVVVKPGVAITTDDTEELRHLSDLISPMKE